MLINGVAEEMGIPYLPPYLPMAENVDVERGINFAVGGATAMAAEFFVEKGVALSTANNSLGIQLDWFQKNLPSICHGRSSKLK